MLLVFVVAVLLALAGMYYIFPSGRTSQELPEPPVVRTTIPFFGHIIGMARLGKNYYQNLRDESRQPIVTLPLFGSRVYAVFSVPIIQSIQKQSKSFSFEPIQARFSAKMCGTSKDADNILQRDMHQENGVYGAIHHAIHHGLSPGKSLNEMSMVSAGRVRGALDDIRPRTIIKLDEWLRRQVTLATTDAVYGSYNPFREKEVEDAFWAYEQGITNLFLLPQCFSPKATRNRKVVADAFQQYFQHGYHEYASGLIKDFYATECAYGYSISDRSRFEVGNAMGILENTYSAVFWVVFHVFSSPSGLRRVREEVSGMITTTTTTTDGKRKCRHVLDMTKVKSHCPFLVSTFKETMRLHSAGVSIREVCRDTILDNTYRLKKGAMVIMPTIAVHTDPDVWGPDALSFNYERFVSEKSNKSKSSTPKEKVSAAAFRTFGGGTTLCPGRHLATAQIMVWISMLVMRFDLEPVSGCWDPPADGQSNMANVIMRPDRDDEVSFVPREYYNDGIWDVRFDDEVATLNLTVDDSVDD